LVCSIGLDSRWKPMISGPLLNEYAEQVISQRMVIGWTLEDCD
jgi:hypothetical protein